MALISMRQLLDHAAENDYGMPAFNVNNMEQVHAIMQAADETDSPVIMQGSAGARSYAGEPFLRHLILAAIEEFPHIPVCMHQDHGTSPAVCQRSIQLSDWQEVENRTCVGQEVAMAQHGALGPPGSAAFSQPSGLALLQNHLYCVDAGASAVREIDLDSGIVTTLVGEGLFDFGDEDGAGATAAVLEDDVLEDTHAAIEPEGGLVHVLEAAVDEGGRRAIGAIDRSPVIGRQLVEGHIREHGRRILEMKCGAPRHGPDQFPAVIGTDDEVGDLGLGPRVHEGEQGGQPRRLDAHAPGVGRVADQGNAVGHDQRPLVVGAATHQDHVTRVGGRQRGADAVAARHQLQEVTLDPGDASHRGQRHQQRGPGRQ